MNGADHSGRQSSWEDFDGALKILDKLARQIIESRRSAVYKAQDVLATKRMKEQIL